MDKMPRDFEGAGMKITEDAIKVMDGGTTGDDEMDKAIKEGLKDAKDLLEREKEYRKNNPFNLAEFEKKVESECLILHSQFANPKYLIMGLGLYNRIALEEAFVYKRGIYKDTGLEPMPHQDHDRKGKKHGISRTYSLKIFGWELSVIVVGDKDNRGFEVTSDPDELPWIRHGRKTI